MGKRSPHEATCPRIASGFHQGRTNDEAVFVKVAMPIAYGISAGVPLSHETSQLDATTLAGQPVKLETDRRWIRCGLGADGREDP